MSALQINKLTYPPLNIFERQPKIMLNLLFVNYLNSDVTSRPPSTNTVYKSYSPKCLSENSNHSTKTSRSQTDTKPKYMLNKRAPFQSTQPFENTLHVYQNRARLPKAIIRVELAVHGLLIANLPCGVTLTNQVENPFLLESLANKYTELPSQYWYGLTIFT